MASRGLRTGTQGAQGPPHEEADPDSVPRPDNYTISDWMRKLGNTQVFESDLQHLVLNFFTINGLAGPAEVFAKEARVQPQMPLQCITGRARIEEAILSGKTEEAINEISLINVDLLKKDPEVTFMLRKQQLLQLIENGDAEEAIDFAQQHLAPCVKDCPQLLPQLEDAMALLAFSDLNCPEAQKLLGGRQQREEAARRIDDAILDLYKVAKEASLELLVKNALFSQGCLHTSFRSLCPMVVDLRRGTLGTHVEASERAEVGDACRAPESMQGEIDPLRQQEEQQEGLGLRLRQQAVNPALGGNRGAGQRLA
ncbi:hypothetical protein Emag_000574 [Eimeria magna]